MNVKLFTYIMIYFSVLGLLLSGYLSYNTLFAPAGCSRALITCGGEKPVEILGISQCIWGFFMFLATAAVAIILMYTKNRSRWLSAQIVLGVISSLFGGGLSAYELWFRAPAPITMPSCVYGFFLFLGVLITTLISRNAVKSTVS